MAALHIDTAFQPGMAGVSWLCIILCIPELSVRSQINVTLSKLKLSCP
jgi:hypothetical protein